jgi:putative tricarboxylic transport membrane protein
MPGTDSTSVDDSPSPGTRYVDLLIAGLVVALGIYIVWEARGIRVLPVHSRVGPRVIPYLVGGGLVVLGIWLAIEILTGRDVRPTDDAEDVDPTLPTDWRCLAILAASLLVYLYLLERTGFVIASVLLFVGAAFGMGSRKIVRDVAIAVVLSFGIYWIFTEGLGLRLPVGWLEVLE